MSEPPRPGADELREQLRTANGEVYKWRKLFQTEAWKELREVTQGQISVRREEYELSEPAGIDDLVKYEYRRGEIAGMRFTIEHPENCLKSLEDTVEGLKQLLQSTDKGDKEHGDEES